LETEWKNNFPRYELLIFLINFWMNKNNVSSYDKKGYENWTEMNFSRKLVAKYLMK
jgi:hypothetical protein